MTVDSSRPNRQNGASAIRIVDLCRHYQMGDTLIRAVDGVSLQVRSGEFVALLGSSGSGKSSLLNLIAGLDRPTSGAVIVEDRDLARLSREELAKYRLRTVGMVFQSFNLVSRMTLAENVELPLRFAEVDRSQRDALTRKALERVGLGARITHRPSELSGGEQQRAALARALINQPKLLLADEPTGNLDSHTGTEIMNFIREFNESLGIAVGVASLVAMLSLGIGLQKLATRRLVSSGLFDTVVVMSRRDLRGFGHDDERNTATAAESRTLDEPARQEIERLPDVLEAYPDIRFITELRYQDKPHLTMISGIPDSSRSNDAFSGIEGGFFSSESAPEVILQKSFAAELLGKANKPGQEDEIPVADLAK